MLNNELLDNLFKYLINRYQKTIDYKKLDIDRVKLTLRLKPINYDYKTKSEICLNLINNNQINIKDYVSIEFKLTDKFGSWNCFTFFLYKDHGLKNNNKLIEKEMDNFLQRYKLSIADVVSNIQKILIDNI